MKNKNVLTAIAEAERFLIAAKKVHESRWSKGFAEGGINAAACKRASLDLTRALAKMRNDDNWEIK
jgi:hypothetical protein